jgi:dihydrolipoamide dehydrogenase
MSASPDGPELLVLGCGAAGYYCAVTAAREGIKTTLTENAELGGTAFRWGCLPVKMVLDRIKGHTGPRGARRGSVPRNPLKGVARSLDAVERRLERRLTAEGVEILRGEGEFLDERVYRVGDRRLRARNVVIATGTSAAGLPEVPLNGGTVISHRDVFVSATVPRKLAIVGADVEGAELAVLFSSLGCRVTLVEQLNELLPGLDRDLVAPVQRRLLEGGVRFELGSAVAGLSHGRKGPVLQLADGRAVEAGRVLVTGIRRANLPEGLEGVGVRADGNRIPVAPSLATEVAGIFAAGDVNGLLGMAHAAIQQGTLLARSLRSGRPLTGQHWSAYRDPPRAIYTIPEIGGAGSTERELRDAGAPYHAERIDLRDTWRGLSRGTAGGFLKLLTAPGGRVLGIWMSAAEAAEASALFGLLVGRDLSADTLAGALITHPTVAEALREAAARAVAASAPPAARTARAAQ